MAVARGGPEVVALAHGRTLVVRRATPADAPGLLDLYRELSVDDRYRRFFSGGPRLDDFVENWVRSADAGGLLLVAVVTDADGTERIVADAGYQPLPDGDGELGMTVAPGWRGWLGPYLLDALLREAAAHGVPNLEADVLAENTPMRRLLTARGCAFLEREDVSSLRMVVGTGGTAPDWPVLPTRARVLVEGAHHQAEQLARELGYQVVTCAGPGPGRPPCPLLAGGSCPLATGADAVVCALAPDEDAASRVRAAHERLHPDVPVLVHPPRQAANADDREGLAAELRAAVEREPEGPPG